MKTTVHDPQTIWINQGDWGADSKCAVQNRSNSGVACSSTSRQLDGCFAEIRLPHAWTTASDCTGRADSTGSNCRSAADQPNNNAMALLLPDNETLVQMQPVYRCGFYPAPLLARWGNSTDGGPQQFPNTTSIFGDGTLGAHGGSGLSSTFSSQDRLCCVSLSESLIVLHIIIDLNRYRWEHPSGRTVAWRPSHSPRTED